ncbi:putative short chain dehydrogenase [Dendryphion nanum]|uniref:Short chain dehydrogenase n=1 Tax=Dendryphion nanum TaxID=256645 RepID=A0A9P9DDU9_9PLEO|nr:putative short chain dehydrogenase [Dendryphion nanum]
MPEIAGSKALIIGGTHGIGLATAQLLVSKGSFIIATGRNPSNISSAQSILGPKALVHEFDITSLDAISTLPSKVNSHFGIDTLLDLVFINAGYAALEPFLTVTEASFHRTMSTNLFGPFFTAQTLIPLIKPHGSIIFTTSISNRRGIPGMSVYSASKAAIHSLVQTLAAELAPKQIRVNAVSPGYVKTPTMGVVGVPREELDKFEELGKKETPLGRIGEAEEVASAVVWLGFKAGFSTGSEVVVDGGLRDLDKGVDH